MNAERFTEFNHRMPVESITHISMKGNADFFELEFYKTCQGKWLKLRKVDTILEGLQFSTQFRTGYTSESDVIYMNASDCIS